MRLYRGGFSTRAVASTVGVAALTARRYKPDGIICPCGKIAGHYEWCEWRIGLSPNRQSYLEQCRRKSERRLATVRLRRDDVPLTTWPYVRSFDNDDYALLKRVNDAVPRYLSEHVRADVCQEIIIDVISGDLVVEQIPSRLKEYLRRAYEFIPSKFGPLSLDAPLFDSDGYSLKDTLIG